MGNFIFFGLLILGFFFISASNKKNRKFLLVIGVLIISIISGFRGINVGIDTAAYYNAFVNNFPKSWQFEENGFRYISTLLMRLFNNPSIIFFIYSIIINGLVFLRLWDFREKCNFTIMSFLYLTIYFIDSMNIMRQFIALAIIFYSTKFLEKKKYFLFFIIVIFTTLIHKTSLLALIFIIVYIWKDLTKNQKIILILPIIGITIIGISYILRYESGHINNYFSTDNSVRNFNITYVYRVLIFIISYLLFKSNKKVTISRTLSECKKNSENYSRNLEFKAISLIYFFGLCFGSMGMFYFVMTRIGYYYLIYEIVYWGYITKNSKNNRLNFLMIATYAIYIISIEFLRNGSGIFPYYFNL